VGGCRGKGRSSGRKGRSYLFLFTILLLWNTAESLPLAGRNVASADAKRYEIVRSTAPRSEEAADGAAASSARSGQWSLRQRYLIGKRLDINTASEDEIAALPGISEETAAAVVAERRRVGRFRSPTELLRVKGIKEKRLEIILPFLARM
jgi:competence ComEA-like helix-hairpin-helix protein